MTPAHYSYSWALSVVEKALEKHARVSESFLLFTGLSTRQLAKLIAEGRPEWPRLRYLLQVMDNWEKAQPGYFVTTQAYSNLLYKNLFRLPENVQEYLERRIKCGIIKEQGSREGR